MHFKYLHIGTIFNMPISAGYLLYIMFNYFSLGPNLESVTTLKLFDKHSNVSINPFIFGHLLLKITLSCTVCTSPWFHYIVVTKPCYCKRPETPRGYNIICPFILSSAKIYVVIGISTISIISNILGMVPILNTWREKYTFPSIQPAIFVVHVSV